MRRDVDISHEYATKITENLVLHTAPMGTGKGDVLSKQMMSFFHSHRDKKTHEGRCRGRSKCQYCKEPTDAMRLIWEISDPLPDDEKQYFINSLCRFFDLFEGDTQGLVDVVFAIADIHGDVDLEPREMNEHRRAARRHLERVCDLYEQLSNEGALMNTEILVHLTILDDGSEERR